VCVYTFVWLEIKTKRETVAPRMLEKRGDDAGGRGPIFLILSGKEGARGEIRFLSLQFLTFCVAYYQPYKTMTGPKSSELNLPDSLLFRRQFRSFVQNFGKRCCSRE
jgi:hypothetical protein